MTHAGQSPEEVVAVTMLYSSRFQRQKVLRKTEGYRNMCQEEIYVGSS